MIFDLYTTDRLGTQAIATRLNSQGLTTRVGKPWSQHTVEIVLTNRIYLGENDSATSSSPTPTNRSSPPSSSTSPNSFSASGRQRSASALPTPPTTP
jgi:Recombinase